jgi:hypothetical protein
MRVALVIMLAGAAAACGPSKTGSGDDTIDAQGSGAIDAAPGGGPDASNETAAVYAHTSGELYRVDPDTFAVTLVAPFGWPPSVGSDTMTDLAIDKNGVMIGISYTRVYRVEPSNAQCTLLSPNLGGSFNGLSFVPAAQIGASGDDVLVASRNSDGKIFRIDQGTGKATQIGDMGHGYSSSGDIVSVVGLGTIATAKGGASSDILVKLAPVTFDATPIGTETGHSDLWGIGFWKNKVFGFSDDGSFVLIDDQTGIATPQSSSGQAWWGAAVTTVAPVIP